MKRVIIMVFAILLPMVVMGQVRQINQILDKYEKKRNVESILVSPSLLQGAGGSNVDAKTKDLLSKITELRIVTVRSNATEDGVPVARTLREEIDKVVSATNMKRVIRVQDEKDLLEMFMTSGSEGLLLFISSGSQEFSVISIFGNIDNSIVNAALAGDIKVK